MTILFDRATELADRHLSGLSEGEVALRLLPDRTKEFDVGWVFYYQSARYLETGDFSDMLVGNVPLFIARSDGRLFVVDIHRPLEASLAAYRVSGDLNAHQTPFVRLAGWRKGASAISAIRAIRQHTSLGLAETKQLVESCLAGESPVVEVGSVAEAQVLVLTLDALGLETSVCYGSSSTPIIPA